METVLVPLDFSDATPKVVNVAAQFAARLRARVILLHVIEPIAEYVPMATSIDVLATAAPVMHSLDHQPILERLERLAEPLRREHGLEVYCEVQMGFAIDEILKETDFRECGVIVLGSHGHGALYHLFTGGVVTGVLKKTSHPVLVVPVHEEKRAKKAAAQSGAQR